MSQVTRLRRQVKGKTIRATMINQAIEVLNRGRRAAIPRQNAGAARAGFLRRFEITSIEGDYLICTSVTTGEMVNVARPHLLRRSLTSHNGVSFTYTDDQTRTADDGADTETQVIVPAYVAEDEIKAFRVIDGTGIVDDDDKVIWWEDANNDGRFWAQDPDA